MKFLTKPEHNWKKLPKRPSYEKSAQKTLMKLTTACILILPSQDWSVKKGKLDFQKNITFT
jgi:hypothetical protein